MSFSCRSALEQFAQASRVLAEVAPILGINAAIDEACPFRKIGQCGDKISAQRFLRGFSIVIVALIHYSHTGRGRFAMRGDLGASLASKTRTSPSLRSISTSLTCCGFGTEYLVAATEMRLF